MHNRNDKIAYSAFVNVESNKKKTKKVNKWHFKDKWLNKT